MAKRQGQVEGYEHSYSYQKEVCATRRYYDLPCKNCKYREKCRTQKRIIDRLNNELCKFKTRTP